MKCINIDYPKGGIFSKVSLKFGTFYAFCLEI